MICPFLKAFSPGRNVLVDELRAKLFCFRNGAVAANAKLACRIVNGNQALPLSN